MLSLINMMLASLNLDANPHIKRLQAGDVVVIPKQFILPPKKYRKGIVLNMAELRLIFLENSQY